MTFGAGAKSSAIDYTQPPQPQCSRINGQRVGRAGPWRSVVQAQATHLRTVAARARRKVVLLAILPAALGAQVAGADQGPVVLGRPERPPFLTLDPFSGSIGLMGIYEYDSSKTGRSSTTASDALLQENLSLATGGGIVSRNFLDWHANATLGLDENWSHSPSENATSSAIARTYDLNAKLLGSSEIPSNFYARRTESYITPAFQPLIKSTTSEYGAAINYQSPIIPTSLGVSHSENTQSSLAGIPELTLSQDNLSFQTAYEPVEHQHLNLNYQYSRVGQNTPAPSGPGNGGPTFNSSYQTQSAALSDVWQLDNAGRYTLTSNLSYATEDGGFPFNHLSFGEDLHMHPTDHLDAEIRYIYDDQHYLSSATESQQIIGSVIYRLFESLAVTSQVGGNTASNTFDANAFSPASSSDTSSYYGNLTLNYTKKVPLGTLGANIGVGFNHAENGALGTVQPVLNDLQIFTDPQPIIITKANVDPKSIAVFNAAGTRRYISGTDYIVTRVGNTIQIDRTFVSNINPGDTVRLNYDVAPLPGYASTTTNINGGLRYNFTEGLLQGLGVFGQYSQQDQSTSSAIVQADQVVDTVFGADYSVWKLTFRADHENRQSSLAPFEATRFSARYNDQITARTSLSLSAAQAFIDYPASGNSSNLTSVDGHLNYQISRELQAIATVQWRNDQDSLYGNNMGLEEEAQLRWTIRQTQIYLSVRHAGLDSSNNKSENLSLQFGLTRNF